MYISGFVSVICALENTKKSLFYYFACVFFKNLKSDSSKAKNSANFGNVFYLLT